MAELGEEEFDILVGELAQLGAEDIVDANVVGISTSEAQGQRQQEAARGRARNVQDCTAAGPHSWAAGQQDRAGRGEDGADSREVGDGEEGVGVEDITLEKALEQVPRHLGSRSPRGGRRGLRWSRGGSLIQISTLKN